MKKETIIFVLAVFLPSLLFAKTLQSARTNEPSYNGQTISFWLHQYSSQTNSLLRNEAQQAILGCGTNALPWLLSELHATNSPIEFKTISSFSSSGDSPASRRHWRAIRCFWILGSTAKPAIEPLTNMVVSGENPCLSAYALAAIGSNSVPALTNLMTHSDKEVRLNAVYAIDYLGLHSKLGGFAVPALVRALSDDSSQVRFHAAMALCGICENPDLAIPALRKSLKDEEKGVRLYAVRALGRYEEKYPFSDFVSEMIPMLRDREPDVREAAANDIKKIDPEQAKKLGIQ